MTKKNRQTITPYDLILPLLVCGAAVVVFTVMRHQKDQAEARLTLQMQPSETRGTKTGSLRPNETVSYILVGVEGQRLTAEIPNEGVLMELLRPDGKPINNQTRRVSLWQGKLPSTGNYFIRIRPVKGVEKGDYRFRLNVTLR